MWFVCTLLAVKDHINIACDLLVVRSTFGIIFLIRILFNCTKLSICTDRKGYAKEDELRKEISLALNITIYPWYDGLERRLCSHTVISKARDTKLFTVRGSKVWSGFSFTSTWTHNYVLYSSTNTDLRKRQDKSVEKWTNQLSKENFH